MKLKIVSDVIMTPITREYKKLLPGMEVIESFEEDLITYLLDFNKNSVGENEIIFVHSDQHFHKKSIAWQGSLLGALSSLAASVHGRVIVSNSINLSFSAKPLSGSAGIAADQYSEYAALFGHCFGHSNVFVFDFNQLLQQFGSTSAYQYTLGHLYQMPYTKPFLQQFASLLAEQVQWLNTEEKKAILVDGDNTLWKGILGEDGIDGIKCDNNADGILHYHFQLFLKAKKEEGFLLCLCSKNNETDVKEVFESKNWPLNWEDFIVKKVNWEDKWQNIQQIAAELNIGTDSMIFIDDNPFEINSVKDLIPGITTIPFSHDYASFLKMTERFMFRRKRILHSDLEKSEQYQVEFQRKKEQEQFQNIDQFIQSLNIRLDIRLNDLGDLERLSQMTGKTNQFNFNKREFSTDELNSFITSGNQVYSLKVSDKFGDYGTVGIILLELDGENAILENFLMSCRALGKRIEHRFFDTVVERLKEDNATIREIRFRETAKNKPAQDFLNKLNNDYNYSRTGGDIPVSS